MPLPPDCHAVLFRPEAACGTGVLTIRGSSGRVDADRARLLADHGALALSFPWFEQPGPELVPLERLSAAIDELAARCDRIALIGASYGAEAALLTACRDDRIDVTVAIAPTAYAWGFVRSDGSQVSKWTWGGEPLPFVPFEREWTPQTDPPAFVDLYRRSARSSGGSEAEIPVETISGDVLLIAGGDDRVWPSVEAAESIRARRARYGRETEVVTDDDAGHYLQLPGEPEPVPGARMARGGTPEAARRLGALAWPRIRHALRLNGSGAGS